MPSDLLRLQYASGRYFTLIYSATGALQWERGYASLPEPTDACGQLVIALIDGELDPTRSVFRLDLGD